MGKKEKVHYTRMYDLFEEMDDIGSKFISYPILVILVSFFHYCFASMHFLFEVYMFIFNNSRFSQNMKISHKKVDKTLSEFKKEKDLVAISI
jgi:hypothetical protein